jgi:ribonuclease ZC3H12
VFSCRGIQIVVDYFKARGHDHIKVFVPEWRKESSRPETPICDQPILESLEKAGVLIYTPSRKINGRRIVCYDDRYIVRYADLEGGVIVSNDQYRDLMQENPEWRKVIEQRLLQFTFANDHFMPPDDPLGKDGPSLDYLLVKDPRELHRTSKKLPDSRSNSMPICPHLGNCTFGRKCRYYHPDREPQKQEAATGSGSSGGSHTPSTSSRSATSSPIPDNRSQGKLHSSKSSREDLYGQFSRYSSSDDLPLTGGGSIDISELTDKLAHTSLQHQTSPTKGSYHDPPSYHHPGPSHLSIKFPIQTGVHVKSTPMLDTGLGQGGLVEGPRPANHTFPIMQVPTRGPGGRNVTEDLTYHHHMQQQALHYGKMSSYEDSARATPPTYISRDGRQYPPPHQGGLYMQQNGKYMDATHLQRDIGMGVVSAGYPSTQLMLPPGSYEQHIPGGVVSGDQSISLHQHQQQHFSPTHPHPQPHLPGYAVSNSHYGNQDAAYRKTRPRSNGYSERERLYHNALTVLPGCQDRIKCVMRDHPELTDINLLVESVQRM